MHVLGLPPAFVLSQDQTLKLKSCYQLNLDVRTSAHIDPAGMTGSNCLLCFWFHKKPETVQTVKLTLHNRPKSSSAIYVQLFVHRMNQTAHISLQILSISKSVETKSTRSAINFLAQPASVTSVFFAWRPLRVCPAHSVWRSVVRLSAAGEGVFTNCRCPPQPLFSINVIFFSYFLF